MPPCHDTMPDPDPLLPLAQRLEAFAQARDWKPFHAPKNLASALVVEAGELLEHFQWLSEEQSHRLDAARKAAVAAEMADVLLYLVQLATALQVDLMDAAWQKIDANALKYPAKRAEPPAPGPAADALRE